MWTRIHRDAGTDGHTHTHTDRHKHKHTDLIMSFCRPLNLILAHVGFALEKVQRFHKAIHTDVLICGRGFAMKTSRADLKLFPLTRASSSTEQASLPRTSGK